MFDKRAYQRDYMRRRRGSKLRDGAPAVKADPVRPSYASPHSAWLAAHPERSAAWLRERIADGFVVHHVDHDHGNNVPDNVVLIERVDHALFHRLERAADPSRKLFDRTAYQRELMRKRREKKTEPE